MRELPLTIVAYLFLCWQIVANFGSTPFKGDLDKIMASASHTLEQQILNSQIPSNKQVSLRLKTLPG